MYRNRKPIASALVVVTGCLCIFWSSMIAYAGEESVNNPVETMAIEESQPSVPDMSDQAQTDEARTVTVTGVINEDYQLVTGKGLTYEIAETEAGDLMVQYIGEEVMAKGTVLTVDDQRILSVDSFEFVEK